MDSLLKWNVCLPGNDYGTCLACGREAVLQGTRFVDGHVDLLCSVCGQQYESMPYTYGIADSPSDSECDAIARWRTLQDREG